MHSCLIFDLDGTLVDSLPGIATSLNRSLMAHGLPAHSDAAVRSFVGDGLSTLIQRAAPAAADPTLLASLVSLFKRDYALSWPTGTRVYPGVDLMLEHFQDGGTPLATLSNKMHDFTVAMVAEMFPRIRFAMVLGQKEGAPLKPDPAAALLIASTLGCAPSEAVIIGDSTIDLATAAHAGMQAIAVTWGYHDRKRLLDAGATRIIDHPGELQAALA